MTSREAFRVPPEISAQIFGFLRGAMNTLTAAARVNKAWSAETIPFIWESVGGDDDQKPSIEALACLPEGRRQYIASKIQVLSLSASSDSVHCSLKDTQFPRLKKLEFLEDSLASRPHDSPPLLQYLQPRLEAVSFSDHLAHHSAADALLSELNARCPQLRIISFTTSTCMSPERLLDFLIHSQHLEEIQIRKRSELFTIDDILLHLASREGLQVMNLGTGVIKKNIFDRILDADPSSEPFKSLRTVVLYLEADTIPTAVSVLRNVIELHVFIEDQQDHQILHHFAHLHLQTFKIKLVGEIGFLADDLLTLRSLTQLRSLSLTHLRSLSLEEDASEISTSTITDAQFDQLVSAFPHLTSLEWSVKCRFSMSVLSSLAQHCPLLETLVLRGSYDLQSLSDMQAPLFPKLDSLVLSCPVVKDIDCKLDEKQMARLIIEHAPKLCHLLFRHARDAIPCHRNVEEAFCQIQPHSHRNLYFS